MTNCLFSIIMPTWNRIELAEEAIDSVSLQTDADYEFIVVDDGSQPEGLKQLQNLQQKYGFQLIVQENLGPGVARNRGAREAVGKYLVFLDSDDTLYPWALEVYRKVIENEEEPSLIGAKFFPVNFDELPMVEQGELQVDRFPDFLACSKGESFLGACNQIVRRDLFNELEGFSTHFINSEDHDLVMRMSTFPGFLRIQSPPTLAYRVHENNLTSVGQRTIEGIEYLIAQEKRGGYPGGVNRRRERIRILLKHVKPVIISSLRSGERSAAWRMYCQCFFWNLGHFQWKMVFGFPLLSLVGKRG